MRRCRSSFPGDRAGSGRRGGLRGGGSADARRDGRQAGSGGYRITGKLGSQLKMRIVGGAFCPNRWLPIEIVVDVPDAGGHRQVVASVAEKPGIGFMIGMEKKYRAYCQETATFVRDSIAHRLSVGR